MRDFNGREILHLVKEIHPQLIQWRREIHQHPEVANQEVETAQRVVSILKEMGLSVHENIGEGGVMALLEGDEKGGCVALRTELDALPLLEETELSYSSKYRGRMHACGHDGHMAIVLGAAKILTDLKSQMRGSVKFLFQPAEELMPYGGAEAMIEDGVLENPQVDAIFALHIWPALDAGKICIPYPVAMAGGDIFKVTIYGKSTHGAAPHTGIDPVLASAQLILALHSITGRSTDPLDSAVLSIGTVAGGNIFNVIPDEVEITGTVRYINPDSSKLFKERIQEMAESITRAYRARAVVDYQRGHQVTINNSLMRDLVWDTSRNLVGSKNVSFTDKPSMASEDFSCYLNRVPGCFFWLGTRNQKKGIIYPLHNSRFTIDEDILPLGVATMVSSSLQVLEGSFLRGEKEEREKRSIERYL